MGRPQAPEDPVVEERDMTAFFSDVASFSDIGNVLAPRQLVTLLREYLTEMVDIVEHHGGTVDKLGGDAVMAYFGAPVAHQDHALRGCLAALDQQERLEELRSRWRADRSLPPGLVELYDRWAAEGRPFFNVRIGFCAGPVVYGDMGARSFPDYTLMGHTVNLAARLEAVQKMYGTRILTDHDTCERLGEEVEVRRLESAEVVGQDDPVTFCEILGRRGTLAPTKRRMLELFEAGQQAYEAYRFADGLELFEQALGVDPHDGPSTLFAERCRAYLDDPPDDLVYRASDAETVTVSQREWLEAQRQSLDAQQQLIDEMEAELQTAHDLQMGLMPACPPRIPGLDIAGECLPANHVGGDFFQYFHASSDLLTVCLADVSGKAMEAAVPVMMFSGILRSEMRHGHLLEQLYHDLNNVLHHTPAKHTFVCLAAVELAVPEHSYRVCNSGCPYPYHYHAETGATEEIQLDAYPLGARDDARYAVTEGSLAAGDYLVLCSDGFPEAADAEGSLFGFERTAAAVSTGCSEGLPALALIDRLIAEVRAFTGSEPQADDMTCVAVRRPP